MLEKTKEAIKTRNSIKYKIGIIVVFFLFMDIATSINQFLHNKFGNYDKEITALELIIEDRKTLEEEYKNSLRRIVYNLAQVEDYAQQIGGADNILVDVDVNIIYESIMNATFDFRPFLENVENFFDARKEYINQIPSIWPVEFNEYTRITDGYGWRIYPLTGTVDWHKGLDIAGEWNTPVLAPADGRVIEHWVPPTEDGIWKGHKVYGGMIKIEHGNGFETLLAHLAKTFVSEKEGAPNNIVKRGDVIGIMGRTGKSKGIHLHYEVRYNGKLVNPIDYLSSNRILVMNNNLIDLK